MNKIIIMLISIIMLLIIACDDVTNVHDNGNVPIIAITENDTITVNIGNYFTVPTFMAFDTEDGDITNLVTTSFFNIDKITPISIDSLINKVGQYNIKYMVTDSDENTTIEWATIIVKDLVIIGDTPIITVVGSDTITINIGTTFTPPTAIATDTEDGDISDSIKISYYNSDKVTTIEKDSLINTVGNYYIKYQATDSNKNTGIKWILLIVKENITIGNSPIITVTPSDTIVLKVGENFTSPTYKAIDIEDGDITDSVKVNYYQSDKITLAAIDDIGKTVNTYQIKFSIIDSDENETTKWLPIYVTNDDTNNIGIKDTISDLTIFKDKVFYMSKAYYMEKETWFDDSTNELITEEYSETEEYDSDFDKFFNANFLQLTSDTLYYIDYNGYDDTLDIDKEEIVSLNGTTLITRDYHEWDSSYSYDTLQLYIQNGQVVLSYEGVWSEGNESEEYIERIYCEEYTATFPLPLWQTGLPLDAYEPDNSKSNANPLSLNLTTPIHTISKNDSDFYSFSADSGKSYLLSPKSEKYLDARIAYENEDLFIDLVYIPWKIRDSLNLLPSTELFKCQKSGTYYLYYSTGGISQSYYELTLSETDLILPRNRRLIKSGNSRKRPFSN